MAVTFDIDTSKWQALMNTAYEKWQDGGPLAGKTQRQFVFNLPSAEKIAVLIGNLNYQVCNGGFRQWVDNGYALCGPELMIALDQIADDEGTTAEEKTLLAELRKKVFDLLQYVDLNTKDRGFNDYWKSSLKDRYDDDEEAESPGVDLADKMDDWFYETFQPVGLPAVERYLVKLAG